jgi:hypothetical protein
MPSSDVLDWFWRRPDMLRMIISLSSTTAGSVSIKLSNACADLNTVRAAQFPKLCQVQKPCSFHQSGCKTFWVQKNPMSLDKYKRNIACFLSFSAFHLDDHSRDTTSRTHRITSSNPTTLFRLSYPTSLDQSRRRYATTIVLDRR